MYKFTTPSLKLTLPVTVDVNGLNLDRTFVTLRQGGITIEKTGGQLTADSESNSLTISLSQAETGQLDAYANVRLQLRYATNTGAVGASGIVPVDVNEVLKQGVI